MIVDELVLKLTADISDLQKKLDAIDKQAEQKGKSLGDKLFGGLKSIAPQIAGIFAVSKIGDFFSTAIRNAQKFEQSMLKAESAAKAFGQSVQSTKSKVQELASDGFLNIEQSARSMQLALSAGFSTKEAGRFITALKDVAAQGNIIGDAGQSIEDFFKGVLTNSADLIENINPQIRSINAEYQKLKKTVGDATAQQYLYNETLKFSELFSGDAEKFLQSSAGASKVFAAEVESLSVAVGELLLPVLRLLMEIATPVIKTFKNIAIVVREFFKVFEETQGEKLVNEKAALIELQKQGRLTVEEKKKLDAINRTITKNYGPYLKALNAENETLEEQEKIIKRIDKIKAKSDIELRKEEKRSAELITGTANSIEAEIRRRESFEKAFPGSQGAATDAFKAESQGIVEERKKLLETYIKEKQLVDTEISEREKLSAKTKKTTVTTGKSSKADPFGFTEARDALAQLTLDYAKFLTENKKLSAEQRALAEQDFMMRRETIMRSLRGSIAAYNEETLEADKIANQQEFSDELANLETIYQAKGKKDENYEIQKQKLRESYIKKNAEAELAAVARTAQAAAGIVGGIGGAISGVRSGDAFGALGGFGQAASAVSPAGGALIGSVATIGKTITSLFDKSEKERAEEARVAEKQREEQIRIAELQASYIKSQLEIQKAAAETPFKNLQKELRLIDINAQIAELAGGEKETISSQRLQQRFGLISQTLASEADTISGGELFGGVTGTAEGLTAFLKGREEQSASVQALNNYMSGINSINSGDDWLDLSYVSPAINAIKSFNVPEKLRSAALQTLRDKANQDIASWSAYRSQDPFGRNIVLSQASSMTSQVNQATAGASGNFSNLINEIQIDTTRAENLLSLIEQQNQTQLEIAASTKQTAQNTTKIALREDRQRSFVDVFGGTLTAAEGTIRTNNTLPQSIGSAIAITRQTDSIYERIARTGEVTNDILRDIRFLMNELLKANDNNSATNTGITVEQFAALDAQFTRLSR